MIMPIVILGVGALSCLAIKGNKPAAESAQPEAEKAPTRA
jgi:hypothetical protein